jgi:Na+-translocating ferredoxin:NAD+ oxidoreductase subunit B
MKLLVNKIDSILPQTQCTKCGYKSCLEYAEAIAEGEHHNQCPPGGSQGIQKLSILLNRKELPLNPRNGVASSKKVAVINESLCIGCKKCILACPVDAIVGTKKLMHTVIENECSGCDLCLNPCPMDCISMTESTDLLNSDKYRDRYYKKNARIKFENQNKNNIDKTTLTSNSKEAKALYIKEALKKARNNKWNKSE